MKNHPSIDRAIRFQLEMLEMRLLYTGTTGQVLVFPDGPIDFTTGQFKAPVEKTIGNLGQYDANGNLIGSNNGQLTGKWGSTSIYSLDEENPGQFGPSSSQPLPNVPELSSPTNDFRVDYTGKTQNDKRAGLLQSSQAEFYYLVDDYRTRFLTDSFIDSLNLPAQLAQNLKNLQYRPDLQSNPSPTLEKPNLVTDELFSIDGAIYTQIANRYDSESRTRSSIPPYPSLAPLAFTYDAGSIVGDYVGLASTWITGFNSVWTGAFSNWQQNALAAISDGISGWIAYRYSGDSEIYQYGSDAARSTSTFGPGATNVSANNGYNVRNVMMFDEQNATSDGVFPYSAPSGFAAGQGPLEEELASIFFSAVLYDISNEAGLGHYKTDQLVWKSISLMNNPTTYTVRNWGDTLLASARQLWPKPGDPSKSIYENDLIDILTSRGIPVNGVADFRSNLPAALTGTGKGSTFDSGHPNSQPNANSYGVKNAFIDSYTTPGNPAYVAYQFYKNSKYGPADYLGVTDGTFNASTGAYNNDGSYFYKLTDREPGNMTLLLPGAKVNYETLRARAPDEAQGPYDEDVRPFGFIVTKATSNGFSFRASQTGEDATTKSYHLTIADPSLATLGSATYQWTVSDRLGNSTSGAGTTFDFTASKDQPITISITRTRGSTVDTYSINDRSNDLARDNGNAFVRDFYTGSITGQAFIDTNGNGVRDSVAAGAFGDAPLQGATVYLDTNNNGVLDNGEPQSMTGTEGTYEFTGIIAGTHHVRVQLPVGYTTSASANFTVTLTAGSKNPHGFDFAAFPTSQLGSLNNDTFTISDKPGDNSRVLITTVQGSNGSPASYEVAKSALGSHLTLHLSAGDDVINYSATGMTLSIDSAGGNKTLNVTGGSVTLDDDPENEDPVKTANTPVDLLVNVSNGATFTDRPDANHDGRVNALDFNTLATNFGQSSAIFGQGDFNYDGQVNTLDFTMLAASFNTASAAPVSAGAEVEPVGISVAAPASIKPPFSDVGINSLVEDVLA